MNEKEQVALDTLRAAIVEAKVKAYDSMHYMAGPDFVPAHAGYKSAGDALLKTMQDSKAGIEKLTRAYERAFP